MDRFTKGLLAGISGGIVMNIWDFISYYGLRLSTDRYLDWAAIILLGDIPASLFGTIFSLVVQILFAGFVGVIFIYLYSLVNSSNYLLKGGAGGFAAAFILYAIPVVYKMPYLSKTPVATAFSHMIGAIIWGLVLAQMLHWLDRTNKTSI